MAHSSNTGNRTFFKNRECYNCNTEMWQTDRVGEYVCPGCGWVWRNVTVTPNTTKGVR